MSTTCTRIKSIEPRNELEEQEMTHSNGKYYSFSSVIFSYTVIYFSSFLSWSLVFQWVFFFIQCLVPCETFVVRFVSYSCFRLQKDVIKIHISLGYSDTMHVHTSGHMWMFKTSHLFFYVFVCIFLFFGSEYTNGKKML